MLNPRTDRTNYGMQLQAPAGYQLRSAICTTYSLDLETLMAATIALGLNEETDSELIHSPLNDIHAIRTVADKLVVFCEAGQIAVPKQSNTLMTLLEKMVVEVALKKGRRETLYPSFHPKTWIILYENKAGEVWGRLLVMSRNLTTDRSWDVSLMLEGPAMNKVNKKNEPLVNFVSFLQTFFKDHKDVNNRVIHDIKKFLPKIAFQVDDPFSDYEIIPMGFREGVQMTEDDLWATKPDELLMVSPFLSKDAIEHWNSWKSTRMKLVTRSNELEKIRGCHENIEVYTIKSVIVDGENNLPEIVDSDNRDIRLEDIHAKMYLWHKGRDKWLYIGSMNASHRGVFVNCEMMLALYSNQGSVSLNKLWSDMTGNDEKESPFELVDWTMLPEDGDNNDESDVLAQQIKDLCRCSLYATVSDNNECYDVVIQSKCKVPENMTIASMLAQHKIQNLTEQTILSGLNVLELSEFYLVTANGKNEKVSKLIRIPTNPMPADREKRILSHYFDNADRFALYVGLVLAGQDSYMRSGLMNALLDEKKAAGSVVTQMPALYEQLLKASVYNPEQIDEIAAIVDSIADEGIVTPEFRETFKMFRKKKGGKNGKTK